MYSTSSSQASIWHTQSFSGLGKLGSGTGALRVYTGHKIGAYPAFWIWYDVYMHKLKEMGTEVH